jgi:hypothetical protein
MNIEGAPYWWRLIKTNKIEERLRSIKQICKKAYQTNRMVPNKEKLSGRKKTLGRGKGAEGSGKGWLEVLFLPTWS